LGDIAVTGAPDYAASLEDYLKELGVDPNKLSNGFYIHNPSVAFDFWTDGSITRKNLTV
jgi:hypothetical protein